MFTSVILAAGMGTRMKSKMPKVLHKVCGKPLSKWVIDASKAAGADKVCAVVGHKAETVKEVLGDVCEFALQAEQKGMSCGYAGYRCYKKFKGRGCYSKR